ncbi:hypothetical protein Poli38472_011480 [Pythium oligandrum]|uniref:Peptidase S1 domain-containing protein n=1 Tax=Pythium oligandrum TaxID=41045 RepID=A0A8K1CJV9_PYTOL|nr:hypothetical protein Poli38472_011480 [Pythium oligandrum]|eukprot:TMW64600.1 hypothetical protein Poli38472_011480 [Pythium oligandrum]
MTAAAEPSTCYPPVVILGTSAKPQACAGLPITSSHVLVHSQCAKAYEQLTSAFLMVLDDDDDGSNDEETRLARTDVTKIEAVPLQGGKTIHIATLKTPLQATTTLTLPLRTSYPVPLQNDTEATLISVDLATFTIGRVDSVVYVDSSLCDQPVCLLPADIDSRDVNQQSKHWSFLLKHNPNQADGYRLLGLGGSSVTNQDGIWGFSWLPQQLSSSSFADLGVSGVKTVTVTNTEAVPWGTSYMNEDIQYIVELRSVKSGATVCLGSLIASRWVLTAANCQRSNIKLKWAGLNAMRAPSFSKDIEIIEVGRTIAHPSYRALRTINNGREQITYYNDVLLVELKRATTRKPIKLLTETSNAPKEIKQAINATVFAYIMVNNSDALLPMTLPLIYGRDFCNGLVGINMSVTDEEIVCVGGMPWKETCFTMFAGGGNPLVLLRNTQHQRLLAIGSAGVACRPGQLYSAYTRVTGSLPFINKYIHSSTPTTSKPNDASPPPVTRTPPPTTKKPSKVANFPPVD